MARCRTPLPLLSILAAVPVAACSSVSDDLSKQLLTPPTAWLAEPADVGLTAEAVEVRIHSEATLTGFWIPRSSPLGTVVLFHEADVNVSALHPYYTFLHDAGFQVLAFDSRGYGRSKGTPTLQAWLQDLPELFDWLRARPDVDPTRIALFGSGLGSVAALWAARTQGGCKALVLEHLPSPRDMLKEAQHDDGSAGSAIVLGFTEYVGLPEEIEPEDNVGKLTMPALFLAGEQELLRDRKSLMRIYGLYPGDKQLWVMAGTGGGPHGMLTHDGEYQRRITAFLAGAFNGKAPVLRSEWNKVGDTRDGQHYYEIEATPAQPAAGRTAIEACALLADGSTHWARTWLDGSKARVRLKLPSPPVCTSAVDVPGAVAEGQTFRREHTALARSGAAVDALWDRIQAVRHGTVPPDDIRALQKDLGAVEAREPFHPVLEVELADVFAVIGKELLASADASEQQTGRALLERAVKAVPPKPQLHFWPGPVATYGFPQEIAIDEAKLLLAAPAK